MDNNTKNITQEELNKHNQIDDCWLAIDGSVYDVTDFSKRHPGGAAIFNGCGKDATKLFNERPAKSLGPHPDSAKTILKSLKIGQLT